jgi:hypothetical protein
VDWLEWGTERTAFVARSALIDEKFIIHIRRDEMKITKRQFQSYVDVQKSGVTNMWNVSLVSELTGLTKEQIRYIMEHYEPLHRSIGEDK